MPPFQTKLLTTVAKREIETYGADLLTNLRGARRVHVVSCYFQTSWLTAIREALARSAELVIHLNRPPSASAQARELRAFLDAATLRGPTSLLLHGSNGLFHSKLYVIEWKDSTETYVGSSNATAPGFTRNEEILFYVCGKNPPAGVRQYLESLRTSGRPLDEIPRNPSLEQFFRDARLIYRPTRGDPFRFPIASALAASTVPPASGLEIKSGSAAFSLWGALGIDSFENDADQTANKKIKSLAIETSYGLWVPSHLFQAVEAQLAKAAATREAELRRLRALLEPRIDEMERSFSSALATLATLQPGAADDTAHLQKRFADFLERSLARLNDADWVTAQARRAYPALVPDLFSDPGTDADFQETFFFDLATRDGAPGRRQHIIKLLHAGLSEWTEPSMRKERSAFKTSEWYRRALPSMLRHEDFSAAALWGADEDDDEG